VNDIKDYILEAFLFTFPNTFCITVLGLVILGFKGKISFRKVLIYSIILTLIDGFVTTTVISRTGFQSLVYILISIILLVLVFNINYLSSTIINVVSMIFNFIIQLFTFLCCSLLSGIELDTLINIISSNTNSLFKTCIIYICIFISAIIAYIAYKKNLILINLRKYNIFAKTTNKYSTDYIDNIRITLIVTIPTFTFI
jgi:hypothetical protein